MKWLTAALTVAVLLLQYRVWLSENGVREVERLERAVATQRADNEQLAERKQQLAAEVRDRKTGMAGRGLRQPLRLRCAQAVRAPRRPDRDRVGARAVSRRSPLRAARGGTRAG